MEIAIKLLTVLGLGAAELWVAIPTGFVLKLHPVLVGSTAAVVSESERSQGYGYQLFEWLIKFSRLHHCQQLHLDSGVQRCDAHRFYLQRRMNITSHHLSLNL
jgi:GNAT superfamily N-acetyltransferase